MDTTENIVFCRGADKFRTVLSGTSLPALPVITYSVVHEIKNAHG